MNKVTILDYGTQYKTHWCSRPSQRTRKKAGQWLKKCSQTIEVQAYDFNEKAKRNEEQFANSKKQSKKEKIIGKKQIPNA